MSEANPGGLPEESLAIANAMALRSGRMQAISEQIAASLQGIEYEPKTPEEMRAANIGRTVLYMAQIDDPSAPLKLTDITDAQHAGGGYERLADGVVISDDFNPEAEDVKGLFHAIADEIGEGAGLNSEKLATDFAKTLTSARQVAREHGTDVATVYDNDELYYEANRRAFSLSEAVTDFSDAIEAISGEMFNKVAVQQLENLIPKEQLNQLSAEALAEISASIQLNPQIQANFFQQAELSKETLRQYGIYVIARTYGPRALSDIPMSQVRVITPRKSLAPEVFDNF